MFLIGFLGENLDETLFGNFALEKNFAMNDDQGASQLNDREEFVPMEEKDRIYQFVFEDRSTILRNRQQIVLGIVVHSSKLLHHLLVGSIVQRTKI